MLGPNDSEFYIIHKKIMPYIWSFTVNVAIYFGLYRYTKYSLFVHIIISAFVGLFTIISGFHIWDEVGIPDTSMNKNNKRTHMIMGLVVLFSLLVLMTAGLISRLLQFIPKASSTLIYILNVFHKYLGYFVALLGKAVLYHILYVQ